MIQIVHLGGDETQEDSTSTTLNLQANITASSVNGLAAQAPQPVLQLPATDPLAMERQQLQQVQPAATPYPGCQATLVAN